MIIGDKKQGGVPDNRQPAPSEEKDKERSPAQRSAFPIIQLVSGKELANRVIDTVPRKTNSVREWTQGNRELWSKWDELFLSIAAFGSVAGSADEKERGTYLLDAYCKALAAAKNFYIELRYSDGRGSAACGLSTAEVIFSYARQFLEDLPKEAVSEVLEGFAKVDFKKLEAAYLTKLAKQWSENGIPEEESAFWFIDQPPEDFQTMSQEDQVKCLGQGWRPPAIIWWMHEAILGGINYDIDIDQVDRASLKKIHQTLTSKPVGITKMWLHENCHDVYNRILYFQLEVESFLLEEKLNKHNDSIRNLLTDITAYGRKQDFLKLENLCVAFYSWLEQHKFLGTAGFRPDNLVQRYSVIKYFLPVLSQQERRAFLMKLDFQLQAIVLTGDKILRHCPLRVQEVYGDIEWCRQQWMNFLAEGREKDEGDTANHAEPSVEQNGSGEAELPTSPLKKVFENSIAALRTKDLPRLIARLKEAQEERVAAINASQAKDNGSMSTPDAVNDEQYRQKVLPVMREIETTIYQHAVAIYGEKFGKSDPQTTTRENAIRNTYYFLLKTSLYYLEQEDRHVILASIYDNVSLSSLLAFNIEDPARRILRMELHPEVMEQLDEMIQDFLGFSREWKFVG